MDLAKPNANVTNTSTQIEQIKKKLKTETNDELVFPTGSL